MKFVLRLAPPSYCGAKENLTKVATTTKTYKERTFALRLAQPTNLVQVIVAPTKVWLKGAKTKTSPPCLVQT